MTKALNDNDELSFITIGAATLNVIRYLQETKNQEGDRERDTPEQATEKEKPREHRESVEHGLNRIREFERRYRSDRSRR